MFKHDMLLTVTAGVNFSKSINSDYLKDWWKEKRTQSNRAWDIQSIWQWLCCCITIAIAVIFFLVSMVIKIFIPKSLHYQASRNLLRYQEWKMWVEPSMNCYSLCRGTENPMRAAQWKAWRNWKYRRVALAIGNNYWEQAVGKWKAQSQLIFSFNESDCYL
jgi:hypothetical protein